MTEFLDLLETVKAEEANTQRMFGSEGTSARMRGITRKDDPRYKRMLKEAVDLVEGVTSGFVPMYRLQEAMSTSDFPLLFGDILDRTMLGRYNEWPSIWKRIARQGSRRDFRNGSVFTMDGAEAVLPQVQQGTEYPERALTEGRYQYALSKYGSRVPFLWEAFVNDDLDALRSTPDRLGKAARMTEERFATEVYVDSTGPDATFFTGTGSNVVTDNKITTGGVGLTADKLQTAYTLIRSKQDADGNPIFTGDLRLVVPPALEVTAAVLLNATQVVTAPGATSGQQVVTQNWMSGKFDLVVNPWLPIVDVSANANTTWYLFADPGIGRPAMEIGFLRGHAGPELFMKSPNAIRIGGGAVGAEDGSFETDGIDYKVRHVFGGSLLDKKAAVAYIGA